MRVMFVYPTFENIGIEYLSAVLRLNGFETRLAFDPRLFNDCFLRVKYLDRLFDYQEALLRKIRDYAPRLVVFSVVSADYLWALSLAQEIKRVLPVHISFGGIHPSSVPEEVIAHPCVDSVVIGEGEFALLDLANSLRNEKTDYSIPNIWFKKDGQIIRNPLRPYIDDLDSLPFPDKQLYYRELPRYKSGYTIVTRRGCINNCSYCHNTVWQKLYPGERRIRLRSPDNCIEELAKAKKKYNFKRVRVNDDIFTSDKKWLDDFSRRYQAQIDVPLYCFGSPSTIDEEVAGYLKRCRCYQLCLGVQSLSPQINKKVFCRPETGEQAAKALALLSKYRIRVVADNIIGYPREEDRHYLETADFYSRNRADRICVFWLVYYPATVIVDIAKKEGILSDDDIKVIASRPCQSANTLHNKNHSRQKKRYCLFLELYNLMPSSVFRWMLRHRLYRFLPLINPAFIPYFYTIFSRDRLDIPRIRYYCLYLKYIPLVLRSKFKPKFCIRSKISAGLAVRKKCR